MEGSAWFRLSTIAAMVLGSLYVLSPTIVEVVEGPEARLEQKASSVKAPAAKQLVTRVEFAAAEPSALGAAETVLRARLAAGQVPVERVSVENGKVVVHLAPGGRAERVQAIAAMPGVVSIAATGPTPGVAGQPVPTDATPTNLGLTSLELDGTTLLTSWIEGTPPASVLLVVDGKVAAVAASPAVVAGEPIRYSISDADPDLAVLIAGALPTGLNPVVEAKAEAPAEAPAAAAERKFPDWFVAALPDTKMNLGLDLQGGIDITLQVELDEAVRAELARNVKTLEASAKADGIAIDSVRRDALEAVLEIRSAVPLDDLRAFVAKRFGGFNYLDSVTVEGAQVHRFGLSQEARTAIETAATDAVLETLRKRIDATGVKEPSIVKKGQGRVGIQLPGEVDLQQAIDAIGTTAVLEFRLVDEEFDQGKLSQIVSAARENLPEDQLYDADMLNRWLHDTQRLPADRIVLWEGVDQKPGQPPARPTGLLPLRDEVILGGSDVANAGVRWDQNQTPYVQLEFKSQGAQTFCTVTGENVGKRFAIVLDEEVRSAPVIRSRICGGPASIEMGDSAGAMNEANTLALVLRTGSLNAPVSIGEVRTVGSTLGRDAIQKGTLGTLIGSALVFLFMTLWYRWSGVIANLALAMNVMIMMAGLAMFGATLTLPGIAGIALTVGMAVDANIIIYERIRDELKLGVHSRKAIDAGFDAAFSAIMDSNITTAISGIVLFSYGTGPIKGFAVTLTVGIVTTLITALFVSRTLMDILGRRSSSRLSI